jgi:esterase
MSPLQLSYSQQGTGKPLVILHGLFGSKNNWKSVCDILQESFSTIAIDLRNHGDSPHSNQMHLALMAQDVRATLQQLPIGSAVIVGHSMGAKVAMELATAHPRSVSGLVLVDMPPRQLKPRHTHIFTALQELPLSELRSRSHADTLLRSTLPDPAIRAFLLTNLKRSAEGSYTWRCNLPALYNNYHALGAALNPQARYDGPVLLLRGTESDYVTDKDCAGLHRHFPASICRSVERAGHWIHAQQRSRFCEILTEFAKTC